MVRSCLPPSCVWNEAENKFTHKHKLSGGVGRKQEDGLARLVAGLECWSEFRLHALCRESPGSVCAELSFSKNKRRLVGGGRGGGWRAAGNCNSSGRRRWRPELGKSKVWKGGVIRRRGGHTAEPQLIGFGSRKWEGPDLRDWRRGAIVIANPSEMSSKWLPVFLFANLKLNHNSLEKKKYCSSPTAPSPQGIKIFTGD